LETITMSKSYLTVQREKFAAHRAKVTDLQALAVTEDRDLTDDELRTIETETAAALALAPVIEKAVEFETRSAAVAKVAGELAAEVEVTEPVDQTRSTSSTTAKDRDPGHYRSVKDGGQRSFFADLVARRDGDAEASKRLSEHTRALDTAGEGAGLVAPIWLTEEYAELARQGRRVADAVRRIPITNPNVITLPKQTAGTDAVVAEQASENAATAFTDAFDTDVDTLSPKATSGGQIVSRQLIDGTNPAIDALIFGDLMAVYNAKVEAKVVQAILAAGASPLEYDPDAADTTEADHLINVALLQALAVRSGRKAAATGLVMDVAAYGSLLASKDTTGRPVLPVTGSSMNIFGVGDVNVDGQVHGLGVLATDGVSVGNAGKVAAVRLSDVLLAESGVLRFRDEYTEGPESIRLAVWGYTGVLVRYATTSVKVATPTAGSV
jgi:predicted nicotinamide N-methyase